MNDAQALYREGVMALRERKDAAEGRRLLIESLRSNPQNDMAWVWLARATSQPEKRLECIERALKINPENPHALGMKAKLSASVATAASTAAENTSQPRLKTMDRPLTPREQKQIAALLKKADAFIEEGDPEAAIEQWVEVLHLQVDHEVAMRNAVGYLARLKYMDDARELVWRALEAGTTHPSIYLTAIDIARRQGDHAEADALRERLAKLPDVDEATIAGIAQQFLKDDQHLRAQEMLLDALKTRPNSVLILNALGDYYHAVADEAEATRYYDRAARAGAGTKAGREADKKLAEFVPVLSDQERGSLALAWREAAGFGLLLLFMGWQDAGLDLLRLGPARWAGVALGLVGGYLVITATSSPQQRPIARWLGGQVPPEAVDSSIDDGLVEETTRLPIIPPAIRLILGLVGGALLLLAIWLVFNNAIQLLLNPVAPVDIPDIGQLM
jgi:tetratricopeptide (TPR) repeat protein